MIGTPEVDDSISRMNTHSMISISSYSLAKKHKRLCQDVERVNGVKIYSKNKKREANTNVKKMLYHLQDEDYVEMTGTKKEVIDFQRVK